MRGELVAIDLETTGLDHKNDSIIEVGAVRMIDGKIVGEFSSMVNPNGSIPAKITHITGISQEDVENAPDILTVLPQIAEFTKDAPVIAHSNTLDMGFLQERYQIIQGNIRIDTYELASVLMPCAPRYNLNSLTQQVGITLEHAHRALDDARATALLYWELWQMALSLPHATLAEICRAGQMLEWDATAVFDAALRESTTSSKDQVVPMAVFDPPGKLSPPLRPNKERHPIELEKVSKFFDEGGLLEQQMPNFENRPQQTRMARAITESFNNISHLMVESGTGTGKSMAYLVPAILWATTNNEHVVISTNTINLQEQLINKDIPALREALNLEFSATIMKGRSNYLCPRRLAAARRRRPTSIDELRTLTKILVWLLDNKSGDKSEINLSGPGAHSVWQRLSANDDECTLRRCETDTNGACPFYKARKATESAHLVIVNHALLVSDAQMGNQVLPDYHYVVVDEAHHFEEAITNGLSVHIDKYTLIRQLSELGDVKRGLLGETLKTVSSHVSGKEEAKLEKFVQIIGEAASAMNSHIHRLFSSTHQFLNDIHNIRPTEFSTTVRIESPHREKTSFTQLQSTWNTLDEFFDVVGASMQHLTGALDRMAQKQIPGLDDLQNNIGSVARYMDEVRDNLFTFIMEPDDNTIYWISLGQGADSPVIHSAPLHVGPMVEQYIWQDKEAVIMISATLRTHTEFEHIQHRLLAEAVDTLEVGSPFDYRESTLVYVPSDIPEPNNKQEYQRAVERGIIELAAALEGRVMVLFTSYSQLRETSQAIAPRLALGDISVFDQSTGSSRQALLDGFKSTEKAVLLGTKSFWEGVDVPGDSLSALIIVRLPFAVPSDPIFAARSETYSNSFGNYALPEAILRFRQGFGRLIRTSTDRGVVAIFDSRVLTKGYGANFLGALPSCSTQKGSLDKLPQIAQDWLKK